MNIPAEVELENRPCPLGCDENDEVVLVDVQDRLHNLPGNYRIVRCRTCELMRTNPRPTASTIGYYYPSNYGPYQIGSSVGEVSAAKPRWKQWLLRLLFDERHTLIPPMSPGRALEVGCASGQFLSKLRDAGWEAEGIEYNAEAGERARAAGFPVHIGQIEHAPAPSKPYDLVVGWMVLEHVHDPIGALRNLHNWTRPGALLAISVPDCGSWEMSAFGTHWYALHVPNHLYHYTRDSLRKVLSQGGWEMVLAENHRDLWPARQSINYLLWDKSALGSSSRLLFAILSKLLVRGWIWRPLAGALAAIRQTGCMTVLARRR